MWGELQQEVGGEVLKRGAKNLFASFAHLRWSHAATLSLVLAAIIVIAVQSYRSIDRELTEVALSRRAAVAQLAAATLSEKFARLVDITVSLATRVRFRDLVAEHETRVRPPSLFRQTGVDEMINPRKRGLSPVSQSPVSHHLVACYARFPVSRGPLPCTRLPS